MSQSDHSSEGSADEDRARTNVESVTATVEGEPEAASNDDTSPTSGGAAAANRSTEINVDVFEELELDRETINAVQQVWATFLRSGESREACGEAIYAALFDAAPSLQSLFKTPRAVMAMRFMAGINSIINSLPDPKGLKVLVETLGFQHLDLEVTPPRVGIFREAIVDLLAAELGDAFTSQAREGFSAFLNYVGGAYIYIRLRYTDRLRILASSWATANNKGGGSNHATAEEGEGAEGEGGDVALFEEKQELPQLGRKEAGGHETAKQSLWGRIIGRSKTAVSQAQGSIHGSLDHGTSQDNTLRNTNVPTTFNEMFGFNAAVMGFAGSIWMNEVLLSFDTIVSNVSNSFRLQEECDVLSLRIAKCTKGNVNLGEYKAVMLASLRSLVPKDWNSAHEVAWSWLWENVERMLKALLGKPAIQERALDNFFKSVDETQLNILRRDIYNTFFALAPAGQEFFKQSTTRLFFIADKVASFTVDMYKDPRRMVEDLSALGLRHVGFGIPTELFGPFVTSCVQVFRKLSNDDMAEEAFRWSLGLVSRILVRAINEGSTVVMKAINANSGKQIRKAVGCAPRGQRAMWMLNIQVGTQNISPLFWAIESGSLDAAKAIIVDLLTIRADRDSYYYGIDQLFAKHPDIIKRLCVDASGLLKHLFDGMIWRSRFTQNGMRRVNYFIKHLLVDANGEFSPALECLIENKDPKLICHPVLVVFSDLVWNRIAFLTFLKGKAWFLVTLAVFITCQSILNRVEGGPGIRLAIFLMRLFIYIFSMVHMLYTHARNTIACIRDKEFVTVFHVPIPEYLTNWHDGVGLALTLTLLVMLAIDPILHCFAHPDPHLGSFTDLCPEAETLRFRYSVFTMIAMCLYYAMLIDLSVFSTRVSAFVLVCSRVLSEVFLFLWALFFVIVTFTCAISALMQHNLDFSGVHSGALALLEITLGLYSGSHYTILRWDPALLIAVFCFVITVVIFLINLLIAQLNSSYNSVYQDMVGYARLNRGKIIVETMGIVAPARWQAFVRSLKLDQRLEFNEGDVGLAGGIQALEPASANPTTVETIRRFGGSTSATMQWPEEDQLLDDDEDRFEKTEKLLQKAMKRMTGGARGQRGGGRSAGASGASGSIEDSGGGSHSGSVSDEGSQQGG